MAQHNGRALVFGQGGNCGSYALAAFILAESSAYLGCGIRLISNERCRDARPRVPPMIQTCVGRDAKQPGRDLRTRLELGRALPGLEKDTLGEVLGRVDVSPAEEAIGELDDGAVVAAHEFGESGRVAITGAL